ncbi:MAG: hypothetical protein ACFFD8_08535 [Candidatus Thorarchaeota archaeon]
MTKKNDFVLTEIAREQYILEWVFLAILWAVTIICALIFVMNILLLPLLGPPWTPTSEQTWWEWMLIALQHPYVWPAALATTIALCLTLSITIYFALWMPKRIDSTVRLELSRIGITTKLRLRRQYITKIDSKGLLVTRLLAKTTGSGEYGMVVLRATFPNIPASQLESVAKRNFLAWDKSSLATVSSVDELHFKITQLARAFAEL